MKRIELENEDIDLVWKKMDMSFRYDGVVVNQRYIKIAMFNNPYNIVYDLDNLMLLYITSNHIREL